MKNTYTKFSVVLKRGRRITHYMGMLFLSIVMTGCPLAEPEALRPLATTKTDKYANKTASKPSSSSCRLKKDFGYREYKYDATGRLIQIVSYDYTNDFVYDNAGYLINEQRRASSNPYIITFKYYYENGSLSKLEQYSQENGQSSARLGKIVFLESGRLRKILTYAFYASTGATVENEVPFKLDAKGRITEMGPYAGVTSNGVPPVDYYEYDSNGNLTKYSNNTPVYPALDIFSYDNNPNPTYEATRFKGHPEVRIVDYLWMSMGYPVDREEMQPNNQTYSERTQWNFQTNMPYKSIRSRGFIYKPDGYPVTITYPGSSVQHTYAEYENCN